MNITGGTFAAAANIYGGYSGSGNADYNTVNITGGTFNSAANIYGGYSASGNANYNTVVLDNASLVLGDLFGGHSASGNAGDLRTGNRLVMKNKATVTDVGNFEHYDFYINKSSDDALLTIASGGSIDLGTDSRFTVNITDTSDLEWQGFLAQKIFVHN